MNRSKSLVTSASRSAFRIALLVGLFSVAPDVSLSAQSQMGEMRRQARREELEKAAKFAENASTTAPDEKTREKYRLDAEVIRQRLTNGDFIPGDRILILVQGDTALTDTFTVRGDRMLPLPNIPPISLQGVLDSELEEHLTRELLRYIKEVELEATPLVRISLVGFPQGNFFTVPVDQSITDVITAAGGWGSPTATAHDKTVVRRAGHVFMDAKSTAEAIRLGKTIGDMALRDGDELYLPDRANAGFNWQLALSVVGTITGLYFIFGGGRRIY
jgi:hypothetical protein